MNPGQQRKLQRAVHLAAAVVVITYVYAPISAATADLVRWVALPALVVTGSTMWQAAHMRRTLRRHRHTTAQVVPSRKASKPARDDDRGPLTLS